MKAQLDELYAPLVGLRANIRAKSELRKKIGDAMPEALDPNRERDDEAFQRHIEYSSRQFDEDLLPSYRKMLEILTAKIGLAEESTVAHYKHFVEFVEVWNQRLAHSIPDKIVQRLGHGEGSLEPFYVDLEKNIRALREVLRAGGVKL